MHLHVLNCRLVPGHRLDTSRSTLVYLMSNIKLTLQPWFDARKRHRLSHAQIQMARELGLNPKGFGKLANHRQEPWKLPLPEFIESLYQQRFHRDRPEIVRTLEDLIRIDGEKRLAKAKRKAEKAQSVSERAEQAVVPPDPIAEF